MKKVLTAFVATGFAMSFAGATIACEFHSASAGHNLKVAMSEQPTISDEEKAAMSTHDTDKPLIETEEKAE